MYDSKQTSEFAGLSLWSFQCNDVALHNSIKCTPELEYRFISIKKVQFTDWKTAYRPNDINTTKHTTSTHLFKIWASDNLFGESNRYCKHNKKLESEIGHVKIVLL